MYLKKSQIIVIKIGSSLLIDEKMIIRKKWLAEFSKDIRDLLKQNKKVILVSSGAIALGCKKLGLNMKKLKLDKSQAIASIGQIELMNLFKKVSSSTKINFSQILLTLEDTEQRRRAINAKRTINNLFQMNFVPIVNENDSIATSEIKYGDNDRLASRVAQISSADSLVLLSDVDGLHDKNPKVFKNAIDNMPVVSQFELSREPVKLEEQKEFILKHFDGDGRLKFSTILSKLDTRMKIVVTFLAILDMVREGLCSLQQNEIFGELELQKTATA